MIETKTAVIIAVIYYVSWLIAQYNKFKGISIENRNETVFWRVLVWIAWFLMPLIIPLIVVLHIIIEISRKITRVYEDSQRYEYSRTHRKLQERYRYDKRK